MSEAGLCHAIEYAQTQLCDMIVHGELGASASSIGLRAAFFAIVDKLPIVCRSSFEKAREHDAFEYVLFYERVRVGISSPYYFLDGIPAGVQLFVGPTDLNMPRNFFGNDDASRLKVADVVADRRATVRKLERMSSTNSQKISMTQHTISGMSTHVPGPARFLVHRTRCMLQHLRANKPADLFRNCENCNCQRIMYMGQTVESWAGAAMEMAECGDADEPTDSHEYWKEALGNSLEKQPDTRRFCSRACANEHATHLERLMPNTGLVMDADDCGGKVGRARIGEAFRLALKRNVAAARAMRTMRTNTPPAMAVSPSELRRHRKRIVRALNVDLGLLLAASVLAESKPLSNGKLLPGSRRYWRHDPSYYSKAMRAVKKAYDASNPNETIISSMLTTPRFFDLLTSRAFKLFG